MKIQTLFRGVPALVLVMALVGCSGEEVEKPAAAPADTDGDGITGDADRCPDVKYESADGCPPKVDSDQDGKTDDVDACADVAANTPDGCPPPPPPPTDAEKFDSLAATGIDKTNDAKIRDSWSKIKVAWDKVPQAEKTPPRMAKFAAINVQYNTATASLNDIKAIQADLALIPADDSARNDLRLAAGLALWKVFFFQCPGWDQSGNCATRFDGQQFKDRTAVYQGIAAIAKPDEVITDKKAFVEGMVGEGGSWERYAALQAAMSLELPQTDITDIFLEDIPEGKSVNDVMTREKCNTKALEYRIAITAMRPVVPGYQAEYGWCLASGTDGDYAFLIPFAIDAGVPKATLDAWSQDNVRRCMLNRPEETDELIATPAGLGCRFQDWGDGS